MNIKKLNEEMRKLLQMNELSSELKKKAIDMRNAEYLAAQATADRKKEKLDRISRLGKKLEKKTPEEINNSLVDIANVINAKYSEPKQVQDDFVMVLTVPEYFENGKLTKSAEEELKELLEKMSDKYGCKYTYKVEKDTIKIICEKPNILDSHKFWLKVVNIFNDMLNKKELIPLSDYIFDETGSNIQEYYYETDDGTFQGPSFFIYPHFMNDFICIGVILENEEQVRDYISLNCSEDEIKSKLKKMYNINFLSYYETFKKDKEKDYYLIEIIDSWDQVKGQTDVTLLSPYKDTFPKEEAQKIFNSLNTEEEWVKFGNEHSRDNIPFDSCAVVSLFDNSGNVIDRKFFDKSFKKFFKNK